MYIDAHGHMLNASYFDKIAALGAWAKERIALNALPYAKLKPRFSEVTVKVETLNRVGYDMQVVLPQRLFDSNLCPGEIADQLTFARVLNDSMADLMEKSNGKLVAVGNVPMTGFDQGSRQEMERAIKTLGLKALMVSSNVKGKPIDSPEFESFWAAAAELNSPVYIHPIEPVTTAGRPYEAEWDLIHNVGWPYETELALLRLVYSGIMERYQSLKVIGHQLGGGLPFFAGRTTETYYQAWQAGRKVGQALPKPVSDYFSRFYYDTAVGNNPAAIECTYKTVGLSQLLFATDDPSGPGNSEERFFEYPKIIKSLGLPSSDEQSIFSGNVQRALSLV
jgi:predicted TIM-barrel fold metal-dependent hydrolase